MIDLNLTDEEMTGIAAMDIGRLPLLLTDSRAGTPSPAGVHESVGSRRCQPPQGEGLAWGDHVDARRVVHQPVEGFGVAVER